MKYIQKSEPPEEFIRYCKNKNASYKDLFNNHNEDVKKNLKESLLEDQGYICCYCGCRIGLKQSIIEHIKSRDYNPNLQLEYGNMVCSCLGGQDKRKNNINYPLHCDAKKGNCEIDISPLVEECEQRFLYDDEGNIYPTDENDEEAIETIKILGLDESKVMHQRKAAIDCYKWGDYDWQSELEQVKEKDEEGCYVPYNFVILSYITNYKLINVMEYV